MRLTVDPPRVELVENQPFSVLVTVTNTGSVIGGYHLRVLGADPAWVTLDAENLSLFPDTTETVRVTVRIPPGVGAGDRRIAVQVRELTPPQAIAVAEIELLVPPREAMKMALQPMTVICGATGEFSLIAENSGNTPIAVTPIGLDPEDKLKFEFVPAVLELAPGEHVITDMRVTGHRRWFGTPVVKPFGVAAESLATAGAPPPPPPSAITVPEAPPEPPLPLAKGTMMQKPRIGRGLLSLLSLLLAVTVFAVVITIAMSRLVGVSAADRDLALQVASARNTGAGSGSSALGGTVKRATDGQPAAGIAVEVFTTGDLSQPLISTATAENGTWGISSLSAGTYQIRFRGAGFVELWYPNALTAQDAQQISLAEGQQLTNLDVVLGGLPASVSGQVMGDDVAGAVLTVQVPDDLLTTVASGHPAPSPVGTPGLRAPPSPARAEPGPAAAPTPAAAAPAAVTPAAVAPGVVAPRAVAPTSGAGAPTSGAGATGGTAQPGAVLRTVPIAGDGLFTVTDLPSPGVYDLVVTKPGFAPDSQLIDLAGGEARTSVVLRLSTGGGLIAGSVVGPDGPLGDAVITATSGTTSVKTLSVTTGADLGSFTLRGLITPATYTVTVSQEGYTTVTSTLSLASDQQLQNVRFTLSKAAGGLSGTVTTVSDGKPAAGVTVVVTAGTQSVTTVTQSGTGAGTWTVDGLPVPGSYTVTFSRPDLQSQTVAVAMDSAGHVTGTGTASGAVSVAMRSAYATVTGTIRQQFDTGLSPVGEAAVTLTSGTQSYAVTSASTPTAEKGRYEIDNVLPGTYTISVTTRGTSPTTEIITVAAGQTLPQDIQLIQPASIGGRVTMDGKPAADLEVDLFLSSGYPTTVTAQTTTGADGTYTFTNVDAPQAYVVAVRSAALGTLATGTIALQPSSSGTLDFTLTSTAATTTAAAAGATAGGRTAAATSSPPGTPVTSSSATSTAPPNSPAASTTPSTAPTTCATGQACPGGGGP